MILQVLIPVYQQFYISGPNNVRNVSKLKKQNQFFNLVSYNALNEVKITKELNIKTVPSTVVLSQKNEIKFVNNGFASEKLLASQLKGI